MRELEDFLCVDGTRRPFGAQSGTRADAALLAEVDAEELTPVAETGSLERGLEACGVADGEGVERLDECLLVGGELLGSSEHLA